MIFPILILILIMSGDSNATDFQIVDHGFSSGKRFANLYFEVITDPSRFNKLYKEIHAIRLPSPSPPKISFESSIVLFVSMGEKPTAGYRIEINQVSVSDEIMSVIIAMHVPSPDEMHTTMMTQPYLLAVVEADQNVLRVEWRDQNNLLLHTQTLPPRGP